MSVMPATAAIIIQRVLFSSAPPVCAAAVGPSREGEANPVKLTNENVLWLCLQTNHAPSW